MSKHTIDVLNSLRKKYDIVEVLGFTQENFSGLISTQRKFDLSSIDESINFIISKFLKAYNINNVLWVGKEHHPFPERLFNILATRDENHIQLYETILGEQQNSEKDNA